jgi:hypothetical protein
VINSNMHILTLTSDREFKMELDVRKGRGYLPADETNSERMALGTIPSRLDLLARAPRALQRRGDARRASSPTTTA